MAEIYTATVEVKRRYTMTFYADSHDDAEGLAQEMATTPGELDNCGANDDVDYKDILSVHVSREDF